MNLFVKIDLDEVALTLSLVLLPDYETSDNKGAKDPFILTGKACGTTESPLFTSSLLYLD